jgi:hypothetical protein
MELTPEFVQAVRGAWGDPYVVSELTFAEMLRQGLVGDDSSERVLLAIRIGCTAGEMRTLTPEDFFRGLIGIL